MRSDRSISKNTRIDHLHWKVADLERAFDFCCGTLRFELTRSLGRGAFVSGGGCFHRIGLNPWESVKDSPRLPGLTKSFHPAIFSRTRAELAEARQRLWRVGVTLEASEARYLRDPDTVSNCAAIFRGSSGATSVYIYSAPRFRRPLAQKK